MINRLVPLMAMLAAPAVAQPALACAPGHPAPTFSIGAACQRPAAAASPGIPRADPGRSAWVIGANDTVAKGNAAFGHARRHPYQRWQADPPWSIGDAISLSKSTLMLADALASAEDYRLTPRPNGVAHPQDFR